MLLVLLAGPANLLMAQETTGAIAGTVMDASGGLVPGAKVEAASSTLVRPMAVTTGADGAYAFLTLPPGSYTLTVTAAGFRTLKQPGIEVRVGRQLRSDLKLEVGQVTESVVVTGEAVIVDTAQSTSAVNVNQNLFDRIPKGRSFDSLIALAPGARYEPRGGGTGYLIDGASSAENIYVVDGLDVTNLQTGDLPSQSRLPTEFIQELQIKSSGFDAQYGGAMGGVVNAIIRSGSNDFHGEGALYLATDGANAGPRPTLRLDPFNDNQANYFHNSRDGYRLFNPGASLGGPIKKDKLWFFASYFPELRKYERTVTFLSGAKPTGTYTRNEKNDYLTAKLDVAPTSRARAYIGYLYTPTKVNGLLPSRQGTDAFSSPWADLGSRSPSASVTFGGDYNFTSKLLASVRGGYNYRNRKDYGIPAGAYLRYMAPNTAIAGIPDALRGPSGNFTTNNRQTVKDIQTRWRLNTDLSYLFNAGGQHNLRIGYETNRLHNEPFASTWPDGYFLFYWGRSRQGITVPGTMTGKYGYFIYRFFATEGNVASNNTGFFFQDQWRVTKRLTLNLGLRTEREFLPSFKVADNIPSRAIEFGFGSKLAPR
ncbi:MAG: TonB-dependent receptor, partial [Acidobacteria bacterium]|nr:TonB-dependent receptor [Acidobacteriota bacterium]